MSQALANQEDTLTGITVSKENEGKKITIDIDDDDTQKVYYYTIKASDLGSVYNKVEMQLNGLENKTLIINVDMTGASKNALSQLVSRIGNYTNGEGVVRDGCNLLWNLYEIKDGTKVPYTNQSEGSDASDEYESVGCSDYFMGTILAPDANIKYGAVNGSIIANKTSQDGKESHNWKFTGLSASIKINKTLKDSNLSTGEKKTFYFNIFTDAAGQYSVSGQRVRKVTIGNNETATISFTGLAAGHVYYVFETDASGNRLTSSNSEYIISGNGARVDFTDSNANETSTIYITNSKTGESGKLKITKNVTVGGKAVTGTEADGTYRFEIKQGDNVVKIVSVTITNGRSNTVIVDGLQPGEYTIREKTEDNPAGMSLAGSNNQTVKVEANNTANIPTAEFTNNREIAKGSLKLSKAFAGLEEKDLTDAQKKAIVFTVTGPDGYKKEVTYNQFTGGSYTIENLPAGEYTAVESGAELEGYSLKAKYSVAEGKTTVSQGAIAEVAVTNTYTKKTSSIEVTKQVSMEYDNDIVDIVAKDAQFKVGLFTDEAGTKPYTGADGKYQAVRTITLKNETAGTVTFENLPVGETYYVYEIRDDGTAVKAGEDVDDFSRCEVGDGTTNKIEMDLSAAEVPGKVNLNNVYYDLPEGWQNKACITVSKKLIANGQAVTDSEQTFKVGIFKENELDQPYVTVEVKPGQTLTVPVELGGKNGDESIKYYVYELNEAGKRADTDQGFAYDIKVDKANNEVTLTKDNSRQKITITNTQKETSAVFAAEKLLDGKAPKKDQFTFALYEQGKDEPIQTKTNDAAGKVTFDKLTYTTKDIGTKVYEVKEVLPKQNDAYVYDRTVYTVVVNVKNAGGKLQTEVTKKKGDQIVENLQFVNAATNVKVQKVDTATGKSLANAVLAVYDKSGKEMDRWVSEAAAHDITGKLIVGETYTLRELKAPEGYFLAADMVFTVPENGIVTLEMKDQKQDGKAGRIQVTKQVAMMDEDFEIVDLIAKDATFRVGLYTDAEGQHPYGTDYIREIHLVKASVSAPVTYDNLPTGTYYVFELDTAGNPITAMDLQGEGKNRFSCNINGDDPANTVTELNLEADQTEGKINIQNVYYDIPDGYGYRAYINITKNVLKNGKAVTVDDTFYAGIFTMNDAGEYELYTVVELSQNDTVNVEVPLGGENGNEPITYYVYETDSEGNLIDTDAFVYDISGEGEVTVSEDNLAAKKTITNAVRETEDERYRLDIMKITEDGKALKGASFELVSEEGEIVASWKSGKESKEFVLKPGTYTLEELKAPKGYLKGSDVEFTIDEDGNISVSGENVELDDSTLKYINEKETTTTEKKKTTTNKKSKSSKTGDPTPVGTYLILLIGAIFAVLFLGSRSLQTGKHRHDRR